MQTFDTVEQLRLALLDVRETYNTARLIQRLGCRTPAPPVRPCSHPRHSPHRLLQGVPSTRAGTDLEQAIARYIREHNAGSRPFVWTNRRHHPRQAQPYTCTFRPSQCSRSVRGRRRAAARAWRGSCGEGGAVLSRPSRDVGSTPANGFRYVADLTSRQLTVHQHLRGYRLRQRRGTHEHQ